ncbi:MAG TPA: hypothetical protein DDY18_01560 [Flavobacterium sp.]|jgi:hypothetical protein|nr:hypothetical protein [Flavobacterium sp.]
MSEADDRAAAKARLRAYLNPSIQGKNTNAVLDALSTGGAHLVNNVEAVNDQLYIVKAQGRYLDQRMADRDITRPDNVGLSDEVFREIGIEVSNRKQVRDLMMNILRIIYGEEFTRATVVSAALEPYALQDGDTLTIQYDDQEDVEVTFKTAQFSSIAAATAQEVADAITKEIRRLGRTGAAVAKDDGVGGYVQIISETDGPASSVRVTGGKAQNKLKFDSIRPTSGQPATQWTLSLIAGGSVRATWTGGPDPSIGKVKKNDYVNIYGTAFNINNRGTFTVTKVQGGLVNQAYFEFENPNGVAQTTLQGTIEGMLFFNPVRSTIVSKKNYATLYQTESRLLEIFIPATTKVVRRDRPGSAHLHDSGPSGEGNEGPYAFDTSKGYLIGGEECNTLQEINSNSSMIIQVDNASDIPDTPGELIFAFGTSNEEGPVPYIARPSAGTIVVDPSYRFENIHPSGTNISLVSQGYAFEPDKDGTDFPFYITDIVSGRIYAEELINLVAATGINVVITILYPEDIGLGKWGDEVNSEKYDIWGSDPV